MVRTSPARISFFTRPSCAAGTLRRSLMPRSFTTIDARHSTCESRGAILQRGIGAFPSPGRRSSGLTRAAWPLSVSCVRSGDLPRSAHVRSTGPQLLPVTMFFGSFAWSFVFVSLPFHIQRVSTLEPTATLRWTGWIVGITSLVTVMTSPVWGRYAARGNPKACYVAVEALQGLGFFVMALARTLPELFFARLVLGAMGAASTLAFIMAGRLPDTDAVRRRIAALQSSMTVGQVIGPLVGAIAAARLGIRGSFVLGGTILLGCAALVHWAVPLPPLRAQG